MGSYFTKAPPFAIDGSRFDQNTYYGRCLQMFDSTNPLLLLKSDSQLQEAKNLLEKYRSGNVPKGVTDDDLWAAKLLIESSIHPDTGHPIPRPFRFCAFGPINYIIVPALLHPTTIASVPRTIIGHIINQSYNASVNFANRNASNQVSERRLFEAYMGAVTSSVGIALGATYLSKRTTHLPPAVATAVRFVLPCLACAAAGCVNLGLIRRDEITSGVDVYDEDGNSRGKSSAASKSGIAKCCLARVLWNAPPCTLAPLAISALASRPYFKGQPFRGLVMETVILCICLQLAVPPALAAYPQRDKISVSELEKEFQGITDKAGRPITELYYNKGL